MKSIQNYNNIQLTNNYAIKYSLQLLNKVLQRKPKTGQHDTHNFQMFIYHIQPAVMGYGTQKKSRLLLF